MPFQHGKHVMGLVYFDPVRLGTGCSQYWGFVNVVACTRNSYSRTCSGLAGANQPPPVQAATGPWLPHDLHDGQDHAGQKQKTPQALATIALASHNQFHRRVLLAPASGRRQPCKRTWAPSKSDRGAGSHQSLDAPTLQPRSFASQLSLATWVWRPTWANKNKLNHM